MIYNFIYIAFVVSILSAGAAIYAYFQVKSLNKLKKTFFAGSTGEDLEKIIHTLVTKIQSLEGEQRSTEQYVSALHQQLDTAVQKVGVIRFNPFNDGGGNLSFCIALLDAHHNGLVVTSMYGREQNRIYTKKLINGNAEAALTAEEEQAITQAIG